MYSQKDPRWANIRLGTSSRTIGQEGCLLCCVAEMLRNTATRTDPARLNRWLSLNAGYIGGNRFVFRSVDPLGTHYVATYDWQKALADTVVLQGLWEDGLHLLLEVNFNPYGKFISHWVSVLDVGTDIEILDPWLPPDDCYNPISLLASYAKPTQELGHVIYRAVAYQVDEMPF